MTDPAIEAAQRTSHAFCRGEIPAEPCSNTNFPGVDEIAEFAAREMAKPIRELHEQLSVLARAGGSDPARRGERYVLDAFAPLIYTSEELER
jgi:hypothetical protein